MDLLNRPRSENEVTYGATPRIWPANSATGHVSEPKENKRRLPLPHMLRRYATFAKAAGLTELDIGLLMNRKLPGVTAGYIHEASLLELLKACQERVTAHILVIAKHDFGHDA